MIIGYKVNAYAFGKTIKKKYFLNRGECLRSKIWKLQKLPFVNVGFCVIQDSNYPRYADDVNAIKKLEILARG